MSATTKKRSAPRKATGRYSFRVLSIIISVCAASSAFAWISDDVTFDSASVLISCSSSRMLPDDSESSLRIVDSMSLSCAAIRAFDTTSVFFVSCEVGPLLGHRDPQ